MKSIKISISCIALAILTLNSCKKKEEVVTETNTTTTNTNSGDENKKLSITELSEGVKVENSTQKKGTPPTPNSQLDFQMDSEKQQGILNEGFDIKFTSTEEIAGAYIRLADVDGNKVDGYIDVELTKKSERISTKPKYKNNQLRRLSTSETTSNEYEIDIDFEQSLSPGKFCYFICLYNASNQVSQIQERCVTIETWGGNNEIVGTWELTDENDEGWYTTCKNGDSILVNSKKINSEILFTFNSDGTYFLSVKEEYKYHNQDATRENCTLIYEDTTYKEDFTSKGQWAYDNDENSLTAVEYEYTDNIYTEDSEVYEEGELFFDKIGIKINGNQLTLIDKEDDDEEIIFTKQ